MKGVFVVALILWAGVAQAETLQWNANSEPDLQGYKVWSRPVSSSDYGSPVLLGKVTIYTPALSSSVPLFYAISAYGLTGKESPKTSEVLWLPPAPIPVPIPSLEPRVSTIEAKLLALCKALGGC